MRTMAQQKEGPQQMEPEGSTHISQWGAFGGLRCNAARRLRLLTRDVGGQGKPLIDDGVFVTPAAPDSPCGIQWLDTVAALGKIELAPEKAH